MNKVQEVIYEPHPVSPERKAELRAAGYRIVDAAYAPEGRAEAVAETPKRRGRPPKAKD